MTSAVASFNPLDLSHTDDPYPRLAALRRDRPVSTPLPGWHVVVRDSDVRTVLADPVAWSSRRNNTAVPESPQANRELALSQLDPPAHTRPALGPCRSSMAAGGAARLAQVLVAGS